MSIINVKEYDIIFFGSHNITHTSIHTIIHTKYHIKLFYTVIKQYSIVHKKEEKRTKDSTAIVIVLVLVVLIAGGGMSLPKLDFSNIDVTNLFNGGNGGDLVDVDKNIDFALTDEYAGSALASKTLYLYDSDGETLLETLTTGSDGTVTTAFTYPSGKKIYVLYKSSNDKKWWELTVPKMRKADAESATVNTIKLKAFSIGSYTDSLKVGGTSISDGGNYNFTASGETPTFTYSLANTGNDNTGIQTSYDPIYDQNWNVVLYITFSGTDYEKVIVYGFDYDFTLGTTHYVASNLDAYALTKHKVGNVYKSDGTLDFTFSLDGTGYTASGSTTMQIYVYAYADATYAQNHGGNFGVEAYQLAEQTVTLQE